MGARTSGRVQPFLTSVSLLTPPMWGHKGLQCSRVKHLGLPSAIFLESAPAPADPRSPSTRWISHKMMGVGSGPSLVSLRHVMTPRMQLSGIFAHAFRTEVSWRKKRVTWKESSINSPYLTAFLDALRRRKHFVAVVAVAAFAALARVMAEQAPMVVLIVA